VFAIAFALVVGRLSVLQVVEPGRYVAWGASQRTVTQVLPAERGAIVDRNGAELAISVPQRTVWVDPRLVRDRAGTVERLAAVLDLSDDDRATVAAGLADPERRFVYVARQIPDELADRVADLSLPGVFFLDESRRFFPSDDVGRAVLGSVDIDNHGVAGLEQQYEDVLAGRPGEVVLERDPDGRTIPFGHHEVHPAVRGDDLVLTLDRAMQYEAERQLVRQVLATGSQGGIAIVSRPSTGEILALANVTVPAPGEMPEPSSANVALVNVFDPGSVAKIVTVAAALEEGAATPQTVLQVPWFLQVYDHQFTDHDQHPVMPWTVGDIVTTSSNIGTIMLAQQVGSERFDDYLHRFGLGRPTGLGFPGESAGQMQGDPDTWCGTCLASQAIGQGISVTAVQMLAAMNVVANGGEYVAPRLVAATVDGDGTEHPAPRSARHRVVSEQTAAAVTDMLVEVVDDAEGTGTLAAIDGYTVAGKTGTARKPLPTGGYQDADGKYHYASTFAGFVPAEDPELSVLVVLDEPTNGYFASEVAAPLFSSLARYALRRFDVPPSAPVTGAVPPATETTETADPFAVPTLPGYVRAAPAVAPAPPSTTTGPTLDTTATGTTGTTATTATTATAAPPDPTAGAPPATTAPPTTAPPPPTTAP
jgi:cell division protein FtsI (penicillin-binding protein 3)